MNELHDPHDMFDDIAVYALGALPAADAARVREHLASCEVCSREYAAYSAAATAVGVSAETQGDAQSCPSTLLKPRIMAQVRSQATAPSVMTPSRLPTINRMLPAYLLAAACLAIAVGLGSWATGLKGQLAQSRQEAAAARQEARVAAAGLAGERAALADLVAADAKRYVRSNATVVTRGRHLYVAMRGLPLPAHGKVYQAWTLPKGAKKVVPSSTFVPDSHGNIVLALPSNARLTAAVAVSVEPSGGSRQPTTKPILLVPLT